MFEILRNKGTIYTESDDVLSKIARDVETDDKEVEMYELEDEISGEGESDLDIDFDDKEFDDIDIHDIEDMSEFDIDDEEAHLNTDYISLEDFDYELEDDIYDESADFAKEQFKKYIIFNYSAKPIIDLVDYAKGLKHSVETDLAKVRTMNDIRFMKVKFAYCTNKIRKFVGKKLNSSDTNIDKLVAELKQKINDKASEIKSASKNESINLESVIDELEAIEARLEAMDFDFDNDTLLENELLDMFEEEFDMNSDNDFELDLFEEEFDFMYEEDTESIEEDLMIETLVFELEDFEIDTDRGTEVITEFDDEDEDDFFGDDEDDDDFLDL